MSRQGRYADAVTRARESLALREQALGPDHPDLSVSLGNFGALLQETGDYPAARTAFERALRIEEARLGPDHPDVAFDLNNLAGFTLR
jgi:hypothetical protein